jgi:hypothetical protein
MTLVRPVVEERLSVPKPGRTLLANVREKAAPAFAAYIEIKAAVQRALNAPELAQNFVHDTCKVNTPVPLLGYDEAALISSTLLLDWISGRLVGDLHDNNSLFDAHCWAYGEVGESREFVRSVSSQIGNDGLDSIQTGDELLDLLPYILEVFDTSSELITALGSARTLKRRHGVFYTPSDVADFVTDLVLAPYVSGSSHFTEKKRMVDPACGTGVFLVSALHRYCDLLAISDTDAIRKVATDCLFGFDTSILALQSTAYCIALNCCARKKGYGDYFTHTRKSISRNLYCVDSTSITDKHRLLNLSADFDQGFSFVISNPPYTKTVRTQNREELFATETDNAKRGPNTYLSFARMMWLLLRSDSGASGMILPLSVAFSTNREMIDLRQELTSHMGEWTFFHFDRTPDSLFGDDVKTRNTIAIYRKTAAPQQIVRTSDLLRWNSRTRARFFRSIEPVPSPLGLQRGIPKVGSSLAAKALRQLEVTNPVRLGRYLQKFRLNAADVHESNWLVWTSSTSYNWINSGLISERDIESASERIATPSFWLPNQARGAPITLALLQSRLTYWLWRVWGDGFHLTSRFILDLPYDPASLTDQANIRLADLGESIWAEMRRNVITSCNAGKTRETYSPASSATEIDLVDEILCSAFNLPAGFRSYLKDFCFETVDAGRESLGPALHCA